MDRERQQIEGGLAVRQREAKGLEIKAKGLLDSVRLHLDPLEKIEDLDIDIAFSQMTELVATWGEYKELLAGIAKAKKILGRE